ncbi:MAG: beta-ketoacyl-ACP synthase [Pseudomonadota bacterium]|nr:beta-ketoacyl-ACP synthase [Pseudomonadota bacterium]
MAKPNRVVVTGMAGFCPLGGSWDEIADRLGRHVSGIQYMPDWDQYEDMRTRLAGVIPQFELPASYTRKKTRTMGRVSKLAVRASELALEQAAFPLETADLTEVGVAYGSSSGCTAATMELSQFLGGDGRSGVSSTSYLRMMPHTTAANVSMHFGLKGRIIPTSSACVSGSQAIGYAYEAVRFGRIEAMVAGGSEALCPSQAVVFDMLYATSTKNDTPTQTPSPYDAERDGLVIGEGGCSFVLESLESAQRRGATILAEVVGYGASSDGAHATRPSQDMMAHAMRQSLKDAGIPASEVGFVCGHGTATDHGDVAESQATAEVLGFKPMASYKGHMGHTLGACGALESWFAIEMMNRGRFDPTLNLHTPDPACGELDYLMGESRDIDTEYVMNNNFAFGGVNSSLLFRRWQA